MYKILSSRSTNGIIQKLLWLGYFNNKILAVKTTKKSLSFFFLLMLSTKIIIYPRIITCIWIEEKKLSEDFWKRNNQVLVVIIGREAKPESLEAGMVKVRKCERQSVKPSARSGQTNPQEYMGMEQIFKCRAVDTEKGRGCRQTPRWINFMEIKSCKQI